MFDDENEDDWLAPDFKKELDDFERMYRLKEYNYIDSDKLEFILDHLMLFSQIKKAKWAAERALEHFPGNGILAVKYAQVLSMNGEIEKSLRILLQLIKVEPLNMEALISLGSNYSQLKNRNQAIRYYKKAFYLATGEDKVEIAIDLAMELENQDDYKTAINVLLEAQKEGEVNDLLIYELAHCYEKIGEFKKAISCFLEYIDEEPYSYTTWYNLGNVYSKIENHERAIWAYEFAIAINESFIPAIYNLANIYLDDNQVEKALETYQLCLDLDQEDPIVYCSMGECYEELGEFILAYEMYSKSTDLLPQFAEAWVGRGIVSSVLEFNVRAIHELKRALEIDPDNGEYWRDLGGVYEKDDNLQAEAMEAYEKALLLDPEDEDIIIDYLTFLANKSIDLVDRAIELNPYLEMNNAAKLARCYAYWNEGNSLASLMLFEEVVEDDPIFAKKIFYYFPEMSSVSNYLDRLEEFNENLDDEEF